jgi:regulator of protease activity HflC (stomatin/prohibitin superfamily)
MLSDRPGGIRSEWPSGFAVTHCDCDSSKSNLKIRPPHRSRFGALFYFYATSATANRNVNVKRELFIKDTHRALWYEDGRLEKVLGAGRYEIPAEGRNWWSSTRQPKVEVVLVDIRERDLTIKGQEILTSDKVAIRVSILVQFRVVDPKAAIHTVENYEERLYGDVQLAARRSLASMSLEEILTNRNQLSEDILRDVKESASTYGVTIVRADVKDLVFPGNLQEIMNRVLAAERLSQVQMVEARTKAETQRLDAQSRSETMRIESEARALADRLNAESQAELARIRTESEVASLKQREAAAAAYSEHPALIRLEELRALRSLSRNSNARLYIGFPRQRKSQE